MYSSIQIGARIKQRREEISMTLDDVAASVKVAKSTIQRYETGSIARVKLPVIYSIANALSVDPNWLLGFSEECGKTAAPKDGDLSALDVQLMNFLRLLTDDQKRLLLAQIKMLLSSQE